MFDSLFLEHPRKVGETYFEHQRMALSFAGTLLVASICCFVHGLVPRCFQYTGSKTINRLHERMVLQRGQVRIGTAIIDVASHAADK